MNNQIEELANFRNLVETKSKQVPEEYPKLRTALVNMYIHSPLDPDMNILTESFVDRNIVED